MICADAEIGIVDTRSEMVCGHAVRTKECEIFDFVGGLLLRAINAVDELQGAVASARHAIAQCERLAGGGAAIGLFARQFAHSGIEEPCALRARRLIVVSPRVRA